MRSLAPALLCAAFLCGCPSESLVPEGADTRDFRVTFTDADATESCGQGVIDDANNHEEYSELYRFWWPDGVDTANFEVWWRFESEADEDYRFFARGSMEGLLNEGVLVYAGGPFTEGRSSGDVRFTIEGSTTVRFDDELFGGSEEYIISDSNADGILPGCVYTLGYTGRLLAEQDATAE
ncbi:MAG: hypothetical protein KDA24_23525 [Deltaproteobacteria bacterium]|nr:hypothetical protein [Deltaproteobacteria bacterium]